MTKRRVIGFVLLTLTLSLTACATVADKPSMPTLYQRLGGREAIRGVVDDFVANVVADNRINGRFKGMPGPAVEQFKTHLSDQICDAAGGPCAYLGRDMKASHKGMKITDAEWSATVEALVKALDKNKVPAKEKGEVLAVLGPMKGNIVGQ